MCVVLFPHIINGQDVTDATKSGVLCFVHGSFDDAAAATLSSSPYTCVGGVEISACPMQKIKRHS